MEEEATTKRAVGGAVGAPG
ncbi:hypothetical protein BIW11_03203 [Tropilaelaps mercedesae]|uniref:Uncharacterized protein n=1 Tax=Tropilaelaps mercedesae TaxID=418985 RepID=A0A1V9XQG2_9ACAR|nr:hypothetical protein BIW11_03203 [Tropilaelaps mercedesae]